MLTVETHDNTAPSAASLKSEVAGANFFKRIKEFFRKRKVLKALRILQEHGQPELMALSKSKAVEMGVELSVRGVQQILDNQGIARCQRCPNRFGLRKVSFGRYLCGYCWSAQKESEKLVSKL